MTVVIIDNHDSFPHNIAQHVGLLGTRVTVTPNTATLDDIRGMDPSRVVLASGPGTVENPTDVGVCFEIMEHFVGRVPILGVCLGHQVICRFFGATITGCNTVRHGRVSTIRQLSPSAILEGVPEEFPAMRYHSLVVDRSTVPAELAVTAVLADGADTMAVEHSEYPVFGLQFHPESVGTPDGLRMLQNFLNIEHIPTSANGRDDA